MGKLTQLGLGTSTVDELAQDFDRELRAQTDRQAGVDRTDVPVTDVGTGKTTVGSGPDDTQPVKQLNPDFDHSTAWKKGAIRTLEGGGAFIALKLIAYEMSSGRLDQFSPELTIVAVGLLAVARNYLKNFTITQED